MMNTNPTNARRVRFAAAQGIAPLGREVAAGMKYGGVAIESVRPRPTWAHGRAGRVAALANGSIVMFHADLPCPHITF